MTEENAGRSIENDAERSNEAMLKFLVQPQRIIDESPDLSMRSGELGKLHSIVSSSVKR